MLKIYLDSNYMCHCINTGGLREYWTDFFDENTPEKVIEQYRIIPEGESWVRPDGQVFMGIMASAINSVAVEKIKEQHEIDDSKYIQELGILINEIYAEDLELIG